MAKFAPVAEGDSSTTPGVCARSHNLAATAAAVLLAILHGVRVRILSVGAPAKTPRGTAATSKGSISLVEPPERSAVRRTALGLTLFDCG